MTTSSTPRTARRVAVVALALSGLAIAIVSSTSPPRPGALHDQADVDALAPITGPPASEVRPILRETVAEHPAASLPWYEEPHELPPPEPADVDALVAALADDDRYGNARAAWYELRWIGEPAILPLRAALHATDWQQRQLAAALLRELDPSPSSVLIDVTTEGLSCSRHPIYAETRLGGWMPGMDHAQECALYLRRGEIPVSGNPSWPYDAPFDGRLVRLQRKM